MIIHLINMLRCLEEWIIVVNIEECDEDLPFVKGVQDLAVNVLITPEGYLYPQLEAELEKAGYPIFVSEPNRHRTMVCYINTTKGKLYF